MNKDVEEKVQERRLEEEEEVEKEDGQRVEE